MADTYRLCLPRSDQGSDKRRLTVINRDTNRTSLQGKPEIKFGGELITLTKKA